ncbi:MAG: hypothetical protein LQ345_005681 [Seirophora villosa]|nr:MAG: hypothetical protein LQ345_005681 [Seirophora villosa]
MSLASAVSPSPLNATGDSHGIWSCTLSASYFNNQAGAPLVRFADCGQTLSELLADVTDFGDQYFEWSSWGTPFFPRRRGPREGRGTPKKYVYGTCTLTVAFLRDLPPWPRKPPAPFPLRYDTSYLQLYWLAESLHDECLIRQRKFGWLAPRVVSGTYSTFPIGVFFWATGSAEDEKLPSTNSARVETE